MIKLVCPKCGKSSGMVKTEFTIKTEGFIRIVPGREHGIERAITSPIKVLERTPQTKLLANTTLTCGKCGEENSDTLWKCLVCCDSCGALITRKPVKDPSKTVDKYICRDTASILCDDCWSHSSNREYCPNCRYRDSCLTYRNR